uniref:ARAD1C06292p n=1 Tax=Blastobotrys adeninivorans TaxID=409370 RepID=A0A060SZA7_BLAAD
MSQSGVSVARLSPPQFTFPGPKSVSQSPNQSSATTTVGTTNPGAAALTKPSDSQSHPVRASSSPPETGAKRFRAQSASPLSEADMAGDRRLSHSEFPHQRPSPQTSPEITTTTTTRTDTTAADDKLLSSLLGGPVSSWNYSNDALVQALALRAEQERTRQEYYKLELRKFSLELLHEAVRANVPPQNIPMMFSSPHEYEQVAAQSRGLPQGVSTPQGAPPPPPGTQLSPAALAGSFAANFPSMIKHQQQPQQPSQSQQPAAVPAQVFSHHHQRNLSLPPQPQLDISSSSASTAVPGTKPLQTTPGPAPQPSAGGSRHHHHASMSALPSAQSFSPVRGGSSQSSPSSQSSRPWQAGSQPLFSAPPPTQPTIISPSSSSSSLQVYQFHHYQPNQPPRGSVSPRKDNPGEEGGGASIKRQKSTSDRSSSPGPRTSAAAAAAQAAHAPRRKVMGHSRHRSEASILRGSIAEAPWLPRPQPYSAQGHVQGTPQPSQLQHQYQPTPPPHHGPPPPPQTQVQAQSQAQPQHPAQPQTQSQPHAQSQTETSEEKREGGVNILARVATAAEKAPVSSEQQKESSNSQESSRSRKHGVEYIISGPGNKDQR